MFSIILVKLESMIVSNATGGLIGIKEDDSFSKDVQYYVSRGFSILIIKFRGSSGFGKKFQEKGVGEFSRLIEEGIMAATFGVYDLPLLFNASNYRSNIEYRKAISKTVGNYDQPMKNYFPVYLFDKLKAPILLITGKKR
jgi:hypothetical protein